MGVEPRRDALVYAPCVFCLKISIGLAKRLDVPNVVGCCCSPFPVKVALFRAFRLYIKTLKFDLAVNSRSFRACLRHENAKKLFSSTRRLFFFKMYKNCEVSRLRAVVLFEAPVALACAPWPLFLNISLSPTRRGDFVRSL